jgi:hypothetical protein
MAIDDRLEDRTGEHGTIQTKTKFFLAVVENGSREKKNNEEQQKTSKISLFKKFNFILYAADPGGKPDPPSCVPFLCWFHFYRGIFWKGRKGG